MSSLIASIECYIAKYLVKIYWNLIPECAIAEICTYSSNIPDSLILFTYAICETFMRCIHEMQCSLSLIKLIREDNGREMWNCAEHVKPFIRVSGSSCADDDENLVKQHRRWFEETRIFCDKNCATMTHSLGIMFQNVWNINQRGRKLLKSSIEELFHQLSRFAIVLCRTSMK